MYVYQRDFLLNYSLLPVGPLERAERLEQLRALENGYSIRVVETEYESFGVDTPEDLEQMCIRDRFHSDLVRHVRQLVDIIPVSYTHLDVYKRQPSVCRKTRR